jgi:DNA-binding response OmpR family regulator
VNEEEGVEPILQTNESESIKPLIQNPDISQQFKILIVDDEPVNIQVLINHLSLQNYSLTQASNGTEALAAIEQGFKPDLILLDVMMPRMTGYEACQKIREKFPANEVPILMLTAKNQVNDLVEGLSVGANDYLTKPISKTELLARIKTHLRLSNINIASGRFVPHKFLQLLNKESIIDVALGDNVQQEMSIVFSDIRDFTTLSESMTPEDNLSLSMPIYLAWNQRLSKIMGLLINTLAMRLWHCLAAVRMMRSKPELACYIDLLTIINIALIQVMYQLKLGLVLIQVY